MNQLRNQRWGSVKLTQVYPRLYILGFLRTHFLSYDHGANYTFPTTVVQ